MSTLNIRIPDDLRRSLDELGAQRHQSTSDLVRQSLRRYLAAEKLKSVRRMTLPLAESQGFLTDEDIFKVVS